MARNIANSLADVTPEYQLARFQLELETVFRQQQQHIGMESQARVDRIQAKMNQVLQANKARITVQEMNKVYDQVQRHALVQRSKEDSRESGVSLTIGSWLSGCVLCLYGWPH